MKIILSRKGFDSTSGGAPSPIVDGCPKSIPIPWDGQSETRYADIGYGQIVERATRGRIKRDQHCHFDPMFKGGRCAFGQTGASQSHLENQAVGVGDLFLFFGLFEDLNVGEPHHRIFGYLIVEEVVRLGSNPSLSDQPRGFDHRHPHTIGTWDKNNTIWLGAGKTASIATDALRLTVRGGPVSHWTVPSWLQATGLSYHSDPKRWLNQSTLKTVGRGQEFVFLLPETEAAWDWMKKVVSAI